MTEAVRKELKKNLDMSNSGFENVILTDDIPKDIVKMQFESIDTKGSTGKIGIAILGAGRVGVSLAE